MENKNIKKLSKVELIVIIVSAIIIALGIAAIIAGYIWIRQGNQNQTLCWVIATFGEAWTATSILLIIAVVNNWKPKALKIISIISICCINAAGLAALLTTSKNKSAVSKA